MKEALMTMLRFPPPAMSRGDVRVLASANCLAAGDRQPVILSEIRSAYACVASAYPPLARRRPAPGVGVRVLRYPSIG